MMWLDLAAPPPANCTQTDPAPLSKKAEQAVVKPKHYNKQWWLAQVLAQISYQQEERFLPLLPRVWEVGLCHGWLFPQCHVCWNLVIEFPWLHRWWHVIPLVFNHLMSGVINKTSFGFSGEMPHGKLTHSLLEARVATPMLKQKKVADEHIFFATSWCLYMGLRQGFDRALFWNGRYGSRVDECWVQTCRGLRF